MKSKLLQVASVLLVIPSIGMAAPNNNRPTDNGGWLGIAFVMESDKNRVVVTDMQPEGPAAQAELKMGDVIVRIGNVEPKDAQHFAQEVATCKPGDKVTLTLVRDGKEKKVEVTVGRRPNGLQR